MVKTKMIFFIHIVKICVFSYLAFVGIMYVAQRKLLYLPSKARPSLENFKEVWTEIQLKTPENKTLTHWYAERGAPYILVFHGNAGNIEDRTYKFQFLVDQGYSVLLVGYRGYGENPGRPTEKGFIADSTFTLNWFLENKKVNLKEVILFGESLGSGVAVALSAQYLVGGLILDGAYSSLTDVAKSIYPFIPVQWLLKDQWNSLARIQKVHSPALFIHSKQDTILPFRFAQKLFQSANEPKTPLWLEHSDHNDNLSTEAVRQSIIDFIQSLFHGSDTL